MENDVLIFKNIDFMNSFNNVFVYNFTMLLDT